jgi:hypothetical protein
LSEGNSGYGYAFHCLCRTYIKLSKKSDPSKVKEFEKESLKWQTRAYKLANVIVDNSGLPGTTGEAKDSLLYG